MQRAILRKMQLWSPIDGVVLRLYMKTGEIISIQPLSPVLEVGDISSLKVITQVDEANIARVKIGQRAWVTADAYGTERFHGVVSRISPMMGPKTVFSDKPTEKLDTKVLDVTVDLDPGTRLPVGLRVNVEISPRDASADTGRS
jgi:multidrug resistance efflux pump